MTQDEFDTGLYHEGRPVSDEDTKTALLVANHGDTLRISEYGEMTVVKRTDTYFGPKITLDAGEASYRLVPAGFARDPELWRAAVDEQGFTEGWRFADHVSAEIVDVEPAVQCECGEVLESVREKRMATVGVCPH